MIIIFYHSADRDIKLKLIQYFKRDTHLAFSTGSIHEVDALTERLRADGYRVLSGPRTTGDGYYESTVEVIEGNQIEITV